MRAPTTLGLAALLLLALGGLYLSHVSLAADPAHHAPQGRLYVEAVQRALGLAETPRFEIWLVEADARVLVS